MCRAALLALAPSALALTISLALSPVPAAAPDPGLRTHLARFADIHGDSIVFTYEGDLWLVPTQGGDAHRITSDPGEERFAKFSPDGKRIAFTANYDGGTDVYVMDARGGAAIRLTYHPAPDLVVDWYPDGKSILFRTRREYPYRGEQLYRVPADAGMEQKLPLDRGGLASLSPDGGSLAYCRLSNENATWKRHKGGDAQDIWVGSLERGDFRRITDWEGIDNYPMWQGDAIYFSSDREHGTANLFRYDVRGGQTTALTHSADYDVKYPSLGPGAIVFQSAETLHVLDLQGGKVRDVEVRIPTDAVAMRPEYVEPLDYAHGFDLSPDGARVVLEVRGEIVSVPAESDKKLATYNLTRTSGSHDKDPAVSPDGKHVAFISDRSGEEEIYLAAADGTGAWRQLTSGNKGFRFRPVWSPDGKYLLFGDKSMKLNLVDVAAGRLSVLDQGEYDDGWDRYGIQDYVFSPDSKFLAYTKKLENTNEVVLLYSLMSKTATPVTDDEFQSWSPSFDPGGRYLYFLSNRSFSPVMGAVDQDHVFLEMARPYLVLLKADEPDPFGPQPAAVAEPAKDEGQANKKKDAPPEQPVAVRIDLDGIGRRVLAVPGIEPGNYFRLEATPGGFLYLSKKKPEFLKYQTVTDDSPAAQTLHAYEFEGHESSEMLDGIANYHVSRDGKKLVYRAGKTFGVIDAAPKPGSKTGDGAVDFTDLLLQVDRAEEFRQQFEEAWRIERDWFYDPALHGVDWAATGAKYRKFLPDCGNRSDLTYLIGEMIAELNAGHTYVYGGDARARAKQVGVGTLGCDFDTPQGAAFHRIRRIVPGRNWSDSDRSPLAAPGCGAKDGDFLIAIDGREVPSTENIFRHLEGKAGRWVDVAYNDRPASAGARTCRVQALADESALRYRDWVDGNAAKVAALSGGRIGYVHLPDMGEAGLVEFARAFYARYTRPALLLDARHNSGGFVGDMMIDRLERQVWALTKPREGKIFRTPEVAFHGPVALLIDEETGSNGEFFAQAIKLKKLARLFGKRTWGGSVGIEPHQFLVDGGTVTPPQYGLYGMDRSWLIEGHGVDPDVVVENMPGEVVRGRDAQLEAGVGYLLDELAKDPHDLPPPPPYPDKAKR